MIDTSPTARDQGDESARLLSRIAELEQQLNRVQTIGGLPEQRYRTLADAMPQLVWATNADGQHFYYNRRWYEYTGLSEAESLGFGFTNALHPDDHERTLEHWQRAWQQGESYEIEYRFRRHDGIYHWFIGRAQPVYSRDGTIVEWVGTCTDIDDQKRMSESQRFLAEASRLLSASLDYQETLAHIAQLAVPEIADWCAVDLYDLDGELRRLAVAHVDPAKVALAQELHERYPFDPDAPAGVANVLRSGKSEIIPEISEELVRTAITDQELLQIMLTLGLRSSMIVPLIAHGRTLGAITLIAAESGRHFTEADLRLTEGLAHRAGIAVDNARLYRALYRFHATLDQTRDCVFMFEPQTLRFLYINQGAINQVGYSAAELETMTPLDIKPEFDEQRFRAMIAPLITSEQELLTFETVHRHRDGQDIPVEIVLQYLAPPGEEGRFVAVVRDITDRRRAEEARRESEHRYQALADSMPLVVWTADAAGNVNYFNQRWYDYTGRSFEDSQSGGWRAIIHPDDVPRCAEIWGRAIPAGEPYEIEVRWRRADGHYRWYLIRTQPVRDIAGALAYWVGSGTDIDDQKGIEAILRERGEELERVAAALETRNRELDQFAYVTSHDLKAPLRGIANLAQWVEEDLGERVTDEARSHLELLRGRVNRMEGLIDGILQYSRVGRATSAEQVDSRELVEEVVDLMAPPESVTVEIGPNLPRLHTERLPLQQVLQNLIGNAIKHGGPGVTIRVNYRDLGHLHQFAVADDGPGIAPQYHERIFGIFQTLASRDKVEGSGLGLALIKKIVEHRRGRVWLTSVEGQGTTFYFTWPK